MVILPTLSTLFAWTILNPGTDIQNNPDNTYKFDYAMYIDDSQMAMINTEPDGVIRMVFSSLESGFLLMGYMGPIEAPYITQTMAADKMDETITTTMFSLG